MSDATPVEPKPEAAALAAPTPTVPRSKPAGGFLRSRMRLAMTCSAVVHSRLPGELTATSTSCPPPAKWLPRASRQQLHR